MERECLRTVAPEGAFAVSTAIGFHDQGRFGHAERRVLGAAVENQVVARVAAHVLVGLLAHDPEESVDDVGFAAAIGTDDPGDAMVEVDDGLVFKGLKSLDLEPFNAHWRL